MSTSSAASLPQGDRQRATKKRQTPAPIPPRLLVHTRRWKERKLIASCFVEFNGKPVASVKTGFRTAVGLANLPGRVTPHTLRHTAATWVMQRGVPILEAAGFLGTSPEVLQDTYGHHHPDYMKGAAAAIGQKGRHVSVVETVVDLTENLNQTKKPNDFLVGVAGFEPATPASRTQCISSKLLIFLAAIGASVSFCSRSFHPIRCDFVAAL